MDWEKDHLIDVTVVRADSKAETRPDSPDVPDFSLVHLVVLLSAWAADADPGS